MNKNDRCSNLLSQLFRNIIAHHNDIFKVYKEFSRQYLSVEEEIKSFTSYTNTYEYLDSQNDRNPIDANVDFSIFRHEIWNNRDFYPIIFLIVNADITPKEKQRMLRLLESYVIRRGVCGLNSKNYNKYVVHICKALRDAPNYAKLREVLVGPIKESNLFPNDEAVTSYCLSAKFYGSAFQRYVFDKIEKSMHGVRVETISVDEGELTIDHILPQNWEKNLNWVRMVTNIDIPDEALEGSLIVPPELTSKIEEKSVSINQFLHTIGNMTLMSGSNNSIKSNKPFEQVKGLLSASELKLNQELANELTWDRDKIIVRSKKLATKICEIWPYDITE